MPTSEAPLKIENEVKPPEAPKVTDDWNPADQWVKSEPENDPPKTEDQRIIKNAPMRLPAVRKK